MLPKANIKNKLTPELFIGKLFQVRDIIHLRHLRPSSPGALGSGWEHAALNSFYESLLDHIDEFVESYQGKYGLINITIPESTVKDPLTLIRELATTVDMEGKNIFTDSWLLNQLDNIATLSYKTIYKLVNLK